MEFNHPKRMAEVGRQTTSDNVGKAPAFLELMNPMANSLREYTIELNGPGGTLRIYCKDITAREAVAGRESVSEPTPAFREAV